MFETIIKSSLVVFVHIILFSYKESIFELFFDNSSSISRTFQFKLQLSIHSHISSFFNSTCEYQYLVLFSIYVCNLFNSFSIRALSLFICVG